MTDYLSYSPVKALVAEDAAASNKMLSGLLERAGFLVTSTTTGEETWDVLSKPDPPNLIFLDWMMPKLTGLDILKRLRTSEAHKNQPFYAIMVTAWGEKEHIVKALTSGADDYVTKPVDAEILLARANVARRVIQTELQLYTDKNRLESLLSRRAQSHSKHYRSLKRKRVYHPNRRFTSSRI